MRAGRPCAQESLTLAKGRPLLPFAVVAGGVMAIR
jgi:hypothetical protein